MLTNRSAQTAKKAWSAPVVEEFKIEEITQSGGGGAVDSVPNSQPAS